MFFCLPISFVVASLFAGSAVAAPKDVARYVSPLYHRAETYHPLLVAEAGSPSEHWATQCCNSVQQAGSLSAILGLLGIVVGDFITPINPCTEQPVCCTGNNYSGFIVVACDPINVSA
ncbi:hydrophobin [Mycena galericulata]|nr:hydrophobin [Mycena galericulata]